MFTPNNMPAHKPENVVVPESKPSPKKPYVRPDHLMQRPFRNNPGVQQLRAQLGAKKNANYQKRKK